MSIEATLDRLSEALEANTAALTAMMASAGAGKPAAAKNDTKADAKPAKAAAKPAKAAAKPAKPAGPNLDDVAARVVAYLKGGSKEEREAAKDHVALIIQHFGVDRFTAIPAEQMTEALDMLTDFQEGRVPEAFADGGEEDDNDDGEDSNLV